jgi:hypothetical protein
MLMRMLLRMLLRMLSHIACLHVVLVALRVAPAVARVCWMLRVALAVGRLKRNAQTTRRMPGTCLGWYMTGYSQTSAIVAAIEHFVGEEL